MSVMSVSEWIDSRQSERRLLRMLIHSISHSHHILSFLGEVPQLSLVICQFWMVSYPMTEQPQLVLHSVEVKIGKPTRTVPCYGWYWRNTEWETRHRLMGRRGRREVDFDRRLVYIWVLFLVLSEGTFSSYFDLETDFSQGAILLGM